MKAPWKAHRPISPSIAYVGYPIWFVRRRSRTLCRQFIGGKKPSHGAPRVRCACEARPEAHPCLLLARLTRRQVGEEFRGKPMVAEFWWPGPHAKGGRDPFWSWHVGSICNRVRLQQKQRRNPRRGPITLSSDVAINLGGRVII